jgi:phage repressor protein C with HTH and peptisase S24 domain
MKRGRKPKPEVSPITDRECAPPINLVAADVFFGFRDPELAGLAVVRMRSDSMGDTLRRGDYALIDTGQTEVAGGGVFAILVEDRSSVSIYQVERVHQSEPGRIRCTPRDRHYTPFELTLGEDAEIIGRMVQKVTRFL